MLITDINMLYAFEMSNYISTPVSLINAYKHCFIKISKFLKGLTINYIIYDY